jgi:hypothetical protein
LKDKKISFAKDIHKEKFEILGQNHIFDFLSFKKLTYLNIRTYKVKSPILESPLNV